MTTAALIAAGIAAAGATAGAAGSAANRKKARQEELSNYQNAKSYLNSLYYRDPLTTVGNRSLLKAMKDSHQETLDAINNRMVAGGATVENQLAAMKANNTSMDRAYTQLLKGEDARRDRIDAQRMQLDDRHSSAVQAGYMQAAQDWQNWGSQIANAAMSYGSSSLLGGAGGAAGAAEAAQTFGDRSAMASAIGAPSLTTLPGSGLGGLKGVPAYANDPNWAKAFGKK